MNNYNFTELNMHTDSHIGSVRSYLDFLVRGDGEKAHCPFTKKMLDKRMFYYCVNQNLLSYEEFVLALNAMQTFLAGIKDRFAVVGVVYPHADNCTQQVSERVENFRQRHRVNLIASGRTTAWTHPCNKLGTHTDKHKTEYPLWVSEIPILMLRSLDAGDESFMLTEETKKSFVAGMNYTKIIEFLPIQIHVPENHKVDMLVELMNRGTRLASLKAIEIYKGGSFGFLIHSYTTKTNEKKFPRSGPPLF